MTDAKSPEPSIEEILASIRKIISDDDPEGEAPAAAAEPVPQHYEEEPEDEDLELTDMDVVEEPAPLPEPAYPDHTPREMTQMMPPDEPPVAHQPSAETESIVSEATIVAASGAFAKLTHVDTPPGHNVSAGGRTVEDIARELLRPVLREWVDQNLPALVERLVERELRKISRKAEDL